LIAMQSFLAAAGRKATPWKNGQGVTTEIAADPPGSDLESFNWRVSIAEIWNDGAFSHFPDVDRQLAMLDGQVDLMIDRDPRRSLAPGSDPLCFPGDVPTRAVLRSSKATDLNVLTKRGRFRARLRRLDLAIPQTIAAAEFTLILSRTARVLVNSPGTTHWLDIDDAVLVSEAAGGLINIIPITPALIFVAELNVAR
jgi:environmental stress-induced protein Ves